MSAAEKTQTQTVFFRVDGPGLNRQLRDFVHEGKIHLALRIITDSGVPAEYLKKIVQGKVKIINTDDPKILALTDEGEMPPDLTSEIIQYALPHFDDEQLALADQAMDLPSYESEERLNYYDRCFTKPNSMPWCWITEKGKFLPCGWQGHLSKIDELKSKHLIDPNQHEKEIEKKWVKVTLSGIYKIGKLTPRQQIALCTLLSVKEFKKNFFDEDGKDIGISAHNCYGAYIDSNGNAKLKIGRNDDSSL